MDYYGYKIDINNYTKVMFSVSFEKNHGKIVSRSGELYYVSEVNKKTDKILTLTELREKIFDINKVRSDTNWYAYYTDFLDKIENKFNNKNPVVKLFYNLFFDYKNKIKKEREIGSFEIAKLEAEKNPNYCLDLLYRFPGSVTENLKKDNHYIEILKIVAKHHPVNLIDAFRAFNIKSEGERFELAEIYAKNAPEDFLKNSSYMRSILEDECTNKLVRNSLKALNSNLSEEAKNLYSEMFKKINEFDPNKYSPLPLKAIDIVKQDNRIKYEEFVCLNGKSQNHLLLIGFFLFDYLNDSEINNLKEDYTKVKLFLKDGQFLKNHLRMINSVSKMGLGKNQKLFLIKQALIPLEMNKIKEMEKELEGAQRNLKALKKQSKKNPENAEQMEEIIQLKKQEKRLIDNLSSNWKDLKKKMNHANFAIDGFLGFDEATLLKLEKALKPENISKFDLFEFCKNIVNDTFQVQDIHNLSEKLANNLISLSALNYASNLKNLPERDFKIGMNFLNLFFKTVLDGTFKEVRYSTNDSPHLKEIFEKNQKLKDLWSNSNSVSLSELSPKYKGWTVQNSDDPQDLFLCGTLVPGSCQSINGQPHLNKCLLAYVLDGKHKVICIKDDKGAMIARSILRLMIDEKTGNPVLMQEHIYSQTGVKNEVFNALNEHAVNEAKRLGLALYRDSGRDAGFTLVSKGGKTPWHYVDSAGGVHGSEYGIFRAEKIYTPT